MRPTGLACKLSRFELHNLGVYRQKLAATFADELCQVIVEFTVAAIRGFTERLTSRCGLKGVITTLPPTSNACLA